MFGIVGAAFTEQRDVCRDVACHGTRAITCYVPNWVEQAPGKQQNILGGTVRLVPTCTNTGNTTLAVNSFPPAPIVKRSSASTSLSYLDGGELRVGQVHTLVWDGRWFQLLDSGSARADSKTDDVQAMAPGIRL